MMGEIASASGSCASGDASSKTILIRGCDPVMAQRAGQMLPPQLGNVAMESATTDDDFFSKLAARNDFAAVMFAPGACRYSAARQPIPGGNAKTEGWTLEEYRFAVREALGDVPIVETTEERQIIPLLREALGLPKLS